MTFHVPVLVYHSLDDSGSRVSVSPQRLAAQLASLASAGYRLCPVEEIVDSVRAVDAPRDPDGRGAVAPPRSGWSRRVGLSFDDGYRTVVQQALPLLSEHGFRATVFVIAGRCGSDNRWPGQAEDIPTMPLLDDRDLERLVEAGWRIGGHGLHHLPLTEIDGSRARRELRECRRRLERRLGVEVATFAYPYGVADPEVRSFARTVYAGAAGAHHGWVGPGTDLYFMPRIDGRRLRLRRADLVLDTLAGRAYLQLLRLCRIVDPRPDWAPLALPGR